ncbi:twin-arginine translocase subunit TatC [Methanolobus psychrotolerans]|uniref:twin-arginine translocase subunit TatC n=1 Tax=Methanolobus psychrotolerans TaxID=1874706 RepID=UPI0013E9B97B|nr:twin-arginine translocase subunit TatC [Methanolobus psychrotolerans]
MSDIAYNLLNDVQRPINEHLDEFSKRILFFLRVLFLFVMLLYPFSGSIIQIIWKELVPFDSQMSIYSPLEWIFLRFKVSFLFAGALYFPLLLYESFKFMESGLYSHERIFLIKVVPCSLILFVCGTAIAYCLIIPHALQYFIFTSDELASSQISCQKTFSAITNLIFGFGFTFQLPLLIFFSIKMGLVELEWLRKSRFFMYTFLGSLTFFISPDPTFMSQLILSMLFVILFEASLLLFKIFQF